MENLADQRGKLLRVGLAKLIQRFEQLAGQLTIPGPMDLTSIRALVQREVPEKVRFRMKFFL